MGRGFPAESDYGIARGLLMADGIARAAGYNHQKVVMKLNSIRVAGLRERHFSTLRTFNIYIKVSVDDATPWQSDIRKDSLHPSWDLPNPVPISASPSSLITLSVYRDALVKGHVELGYFQARLADLLSGTPDTVHALVSDDSPGSKIAVNLQIDTLSLDPLLEHLDKAANHLNKQPRRDSVAYLLQQALHILGSLLKLLKPVVDVHALVQCAYAMLLAVHKGVSKCAGVEGGIRDLVAELRNTLDHARHLHTIKGVQGTEQYFRDVAQLTNQTAGLIEEWLHPIIPARIKNASSIESRLSECKARLSQLKASLCACHGNGVDIQGLHSYHTDHMSSDKPSVPIQMTTIGN